MSCLGTQLSAAEADRENKVLSVSGFGDALRVPPEVLNGLSNFTVEFWLYRQFRTSTSTELSASGSGLSVEISGGNTDASISISILNKERLYQSLDGSIPLRNWTHVAAIRAKDRIEIYLDGELTQATTSQDSAPILEGVS